MMTCVRCLPCWGSSVISAPSLVETEPLIQLSGVSKRFDTHPPVAALAEIELTVQKGEILGIIGRSGAGKSTLLRLLNGLERPSTGKVQVAGREISALDEAGLRAVRREIGMIFQHFNLLANRTAAENVALPLEIAGMAKPERDRRVAELLALVGLAEKSRSYPAELSGGQKQRVGIARALATGPRLLLSDEATSALDPETTRQILALLRRINAELGLTIVLITHEMQVIREVATRVVVIERGRIVEEGPVARVFARPATETTRILVGEATGGDLPAMLAERLVPAPIPGGQAVLKIVFTGPNATAPVLSRLTRLSGLDVNILSGRVDELGGEPFGVLVVGIPADPVRLAAIRAELHALGLETELLGHVP